jgi:hypothetical protein
LRIAIYVNSRTSPLDFLIHMRDTLASGIIELPAFPQVVIKVQEAYKDPNYTPQLVARLISAEPIEPDGRQLSARAFVYTTHTENRPHSGNRIAGIAAGAPLYGGVWPPTICADVSSV